MSKNGENNSLQFLTKLLENQDSLEEGAGGGQAGGDSNHCYGGEGGHDDCLEGEGGGQTEDVQLGEAEGGPRSLLRTVWREWKGRPRRGLLL